MTSIYGIYFIVIMIPVLIYLILDYIGPSKIYLRNDKIFGFSCLRANDLIVQEFDHNKNLWASRGMLVYMLKEGENTFVRITRVPAGPSVLWLYNFTIVRKLSLRPECLEIVIDKMGNKCALSGGHVWYSPNDSHHFSKSIKLQHFGFKIGRGIMSNGILSINETFFWGEYFNNLEKTEVKIYKSSNYGETWEIANEFKRGSIRHIHALLPDPYSEKLWICTGDKDDESIIGYSDDNYNTISPIANGNQIARSVMLVFTENAVYWGTDSGSSDLSGIYRWDRKRQEVTKVGELNAAMFYGTRLANDIIVMSSEVEGARKEIDDKTRLYLIDKNDKIRTIDCGTWNIKKKGFRFSPARLRFQRNQGSNSLAITCINQKEIPNGELIIISEDLLT